MKMCWERAVSNANVFLFIGIIGEILLKRIAKISKDY